MNPHRAPVIQTAQELGLSIRSLSDLNGVIGACFGLDGLILSETDLSPAFFDLRSGLAGETFQKFTNYRIRVALVLPDFAAHGERFAELAREHSAHPLIRFVPSAHAARAWLEG